MIIQALYELQHERGHLGQADLEALAARLNEPLYRLQELVSFFPHFRTTPPAAIEVHVCRDMSCHLGGAEEICQLLRQLESELGNGSLRVQEVSCLGRCDRAPAAIVNDERAYLGREPEELRQIVQQLAAGEDCAADSDLAHPAYQNPKWQIDVYDSRPPYGAVRRYLENPDPEGVISSLETAGLLGMGGAGGRAYKKWDDVRRAEGLRKFVICNADESEPGTFKDRELLLRTPHLVLEGMILGALVVGAQKGYVYVRHEYPEQIEMMKAAIADARQAGVCGANILGSGLTFDVEVFVSPGGYICGEQSALIEAIEDRRAEPRNRPPQLQTNGLFDQPTLLNNVETFAWVPSIVLKDEGRWFAEQGEGDARGLRFFSISGDVVRPGVYEVASGITLGDLIDKHAGGLHAGQSLKAVALSGPSGGFLPAHVGREHFNSRFAETLPAGTRTLDVRDLELDIGVFRRMGLMLGAGIVVYDDRRDLIREGLRCLEFFRNESCGKCVPCRIGSQKLVEIMTRLKDHELDSSGFQDQVPLVKELSATMNITSICGLGQVASNPLQSLLAFFPDEFDRYLSKRHI